MSVDFHSYDFLDFGASEGGSIDLAQRLFAAGKGLGIDIDPERVEDMRRAGLDCLEADITSLEVPTDAVRFVVISHLLEHLPNLEMVEATMRSAARVARDFIFIQGPYFDSDHYLEENGLKLYWADWFGHPCHLTTWELRECLDAIGLDDYVMMVSDPIEHSDHWAVHPLASPPDQHDYDPQVHPPKKSMAFDHKLYREIHCCVRLRPFDSWPMVVETVKTYKGATILDGEGAHTAALRQSRKQRVEWNVADSDHLLRSRMREIHRRLLIERIWHYPNYLHARAALLQADGIETALFSDRSRSYMVVALALEFPHVDFSVLPPPDMPDGNYEALADLIQAWDLHNVRLLPDGDQPETRFDFVGMLDLLRGDDEDRQRVGRLADLSRRYFWLLSPFRGQPAGPGTWIGYDRQAFCDLLPGGDLLALRGAYWKDGAVALKNELESSTDEEITARFPELRDLGADDLVDEGPLIGLALGMWALVERLEP